MRVSSKEIGPQRYRESFGRYYEDFNAGDVYEHRPGRTIGESDNTWFTLLTMTQHPLHFDEAYAVHSEFKRPLVNSCLTLSLVAGMSVSDLSQKVIANLGWDKVRLTAPVFVGDTSLRGVRDPLQAGIEIAPHPGHRLRPHYGQESRWHGCHHLRAHLPRAETRPRGG